MPVYVAHAEFRFEADHVDAAGRRLHELANATRTIGFQLKHARVESPPGGAESDEAGVGYVGDEQNSDPSSR
jgi:hypothetical protein